MGRTGSNTVGKSKTRSIHGLNENRSIDRTGSNHGSNENRIIGRIGSNHGSNGVERGRTRSKRVRLSQFMGRTRIES